MSDVSFERKFGQLVDAQINEKLPSLVDSRIGFQVIDKNEEETRAIGVAAFVVSNVWLYIPIFFINGEIKGFDLVYIKNKDLFLPAMDNWIEAIKDQGISVLGESKSSPGDDQFSASPSDTQIFTTEATTFGKTAAFDANSIIEKEDWDKMKVHYAKVLTPDILTDIPKLGKTACKTFIDTFLNNPDFANSLFEHYSVEDLQKVAAEAVHVAHPEESPEEHLVKFYTDSTSKEAKHELEDPEKRLLMRQGIYVRDNRTNHTKVFQESIDSSTYQNPTSNGIYDIFLQDGSHKTMIVLLPQCLSDIPNYSKASRQSNLGRPAALIDPSSPKKYIRKLNKEIYCKPSTNITQKEVTGLQGGVKASLRSLRDLKQDVFLLFVQSNTCAIETRLHAKKKSGDGSTYATVLNTTGNGNASIAPMEGNEEVMIEFTGPDGKLKVHGNKLFVPEGTRLFTMDPYGKPNEAEELLYGGPSTIYQLMHKQAGVKHLSVYCSGTQAEMKFSGESTGMMDKLAAVEHLILDHGVEASQVMTVMKEAEAALYNTKNFYIKHAAAYDSAAYGKAQRPFMGGPGGKHEYAVKTSLDTKKGRQQSGPKSADNENILPEEAINQASKASQSGIKEVFDVAVIESLVDVADVGELRRDYITDMIQGMDKVGRMLFLFYWHNDEFEDRYGKEDMIKLEDTMKQVFQSMGDLVLFLKEKTAFNPESAESLLGSLSEGIATAGE